MRALTLAALALALAASATAASAADPNPGSPAAARERQMKAVVHAWSNRLNARDDDGAARLFKLPAIVAQNFVARFRTRAELAEWHSLLPCSGKITSIVIRGRYALAVFRLGDRRGAPCASRGAHAAARFEIVGGKIVSWVQIPVPDDQQPYSGTVA
jgi:hypothetical protein